jgi:hypothetical protein
MVFALIFLPPIQYLLCLVFFCLRRVLYSGRIKVLIDVMFVLGVCISVGLEESIFEALI